MAEIQSHSPELVEQTKRVSGELIRIAILWHEQWHEALEEASRLYFGELDVEGMLANLMPLHDKLNKAIENPDEGETQSEKYFKAVRAAPHSIAAPHERRGGSVRNKQNTSGARADLWRGPHGRVPVVPQVQGVAARRGPAAGVGPVLPHLPPRQ